MEVEEAEVLDLRVVWLEEAVAVVMLVMMRRLRVGLVAVVLVVVQAQSFEVLEEA